MAQELTIIARRNSIMIEKQIFESSLLNEQYEKISHPSGLDIYVFKKDFTSTYAIFGVKYGSIHTRFTNENGELVTVPDGVAHFLEHKLFTNEDGSDSFERFSEYGADANAYTSFNKTAYLFSCTENFESSLRELIRFVTHPYFTQKSVDSEMGIITEEIKMYDDNPSDRCFYGMLEGMYKNHSIRRNICGSAKSIAQITPDILYSCYNAFYNLKNMALVVCGNVDSDTVTQIANEELPSLCATFNVHTDNENKNEESSVFCDYIEEHMHVSKPIFNIGFKDTDIPEDAVMRQKKDAVMSILDEIIFSRAGKLYNTLFEKNLISPNMSYGYTVSPSSAYNSVAGESDDPKQVLKEIFKYIDELRTNGLSYSDFLRGKRVMYAEFVKSFDSTDNIANNLITFVFEGAELLSYADIIQSVTFEDVCDAFKKAFAPECTTLSVILPKE